VHHHNLQYTTPISDAHNLPLAKNWRLKAVPCSARALKNFKGDATLYSFILKGRMVGENYLASLPDWGGRITVESMAEWSWNTQ